MQRPKRTACLAFAAAIGCAAAIAVAAARADECEDAVKALEKRMNEIRATRKQDDSRTTICARLGRISGLTQAVGIVAEHCMDEGGRRDALMKDAIESERAYEVDNVCR